MSDRLILTVLAIAFAFALFTLGGRAFIGLDADEHEREASVIQSEIRRDTNARRLRDAELFYGDLRIMHERRLRELEAQPRTKKDGAGNDSLVTDSGGAAGASDGDRKGDGYRHTKGAGMKEEAVYRVPPAEVHRASSFRTPESVASESVSSLAATATDTLPCRVKTCTPPPTWRSVRSIPPLDAPLRFGSADGRGMWTWLKAGESSTPCTVAEKARLRRISAEHADSYRRACDAKIGEAFLSTLQFQLPRVRSSATLSLQAESVTFGPEYTAYVVTGHPRKCYGMLLPPTRCWGAWHSPDNSAFIAVWMPRIANANRVIVVFGGVPPSPIAGWYEAEVRHDDDWIILPVRSSHFAPFRGWPNPHETIEVKASAYGSRNVGILWEPGVGEVLLSRVDINLLPSMQWGGVWP